MLRQALLMTSLLLPLIFADYGPGHDGSHAHHGDSGHHHHEHEHAHHEHAHHEHAHHDHGHTNHSHGKAHNLHHGHHEEHGHNDHAQEQSSNSCREVQVDSCNKKPVTSCSPPSTECSYSKEQRCSTQVQQVCQEESPVCEDVVTCQTKVMGEVCTNSACKTEVCDNPQQECRVVQEERCNTRCEKVCKNVHYAQECEYRPIERCIKEDKTMCSVVRQMHEICTPVLDKVCTRSSYLPCSKVVEEKCMEQEVCKVEEKQECQTDRWSICNVTSCEEHCEEVGQEEQCESSYNSCNYVPLTACKPLPKESCSLGPLETRCTTVPVRTCSLQTTCVPVETSTCKHHKETCIYVERLECEMQCVVPSCHMVPCDHQVCQENRVEECSTEQRCSEGSGQKCRDVEQEVCSDVMVEHCHDTQNTRELQFPSHVSSDQYKEGGEVCSTNLEDVCVKKWETVCD